VGEYQRLLSTVEQFIRDAARLVQIAAADSERTIDHGRVVEHDEFVARRCAVALDQLERQPGERFRKLLWVRDRRRAADELRRRSVEFADALQSAQQVR